MNWFKFKSPLINIILAEIKNTKLEKIMVFNQKKESRNILGMGQFTEGWVSKGR